jgi:hypothetical protein
MRAVLWPWMPSQTHGENARAQGSAKSFMRSEVLSFPWVSCGEHRRRPGPVGFMWGHELYEPGLQGVARCICRAQVLVQEAASGS